jgi:hypothetical protein
MEIETNSSLKLKGDVIVESDIVALSKAYTKRKTPKKCGNSNWRLS